MSSCTKLKYLSICCFKECNYLTSIIFPPNLQTLSKGSLCKLKSIARLDFPSSLMYIDNYQEPYGRTVGECSLLKNVTWGDDPKIKIIGSHAFASDVSLRYIFIPASVETISPGSFSLCPIDQIEIDKNNTKYSTDGVSIYTKGFASLVFCPPSKKGKYYIHENVTVLSENSFADTLFSEVILPSNLKSLLSNCFMSSKIEYINISFNVTRVNASVFTNCFYLKKIDFNANIRYLYNSLFYKCHSLVRFEIPKTIQEIHSLVFFNCISMLYISIPRNVTIISNGAFAGINGSVFLDFEEGSNHRFENNTLLSSDNKTFIAYIGDSTKELNITIADSIETIGMKAFDGYKVKYIILSKSSNLRIIQKESFRGSTMESVELPDVVEEIHDSAFEDCLYLKEFYFGKSLREIRKRAFAGTAIKDIVLPSTALYIRSRAFAECKNIRTVYLVNGLLEIEDECFAESSIKSINIPSTVVQMKKDIFAWSDLESVTFAPIIGESRSFIIGDDTFRNSHKLYSISFGLGTKAIGDRAFQGCIKLESVTLSDTIENISSRAFSGCTLLKELILGRESALKNIGNFVFEDCPNLIRFVVPEESNNLCTSDEKDVLFDKDKKNIIMYLPASNRSSFTVPDSVQQIGAYSFQGAVNLVNVTILKAPITYIGFGAFNGCINLMHINLPESVKIISSFAFDGCVSLDCGSIIFSSSSQREMLMDQLIAAGAPEKSLYFCATSFFTGSYGTSNNVLLFSAFSSFSDGNDALLN